jgi:predicted outer membrane repeat protein
VTFNCGSAPVSITLTQQKTISSETTVDGGGLITLDGNHAEGAFYVAQAGALSVANLTFVNGGSCCAAIGNSGGTLTVTNCTFAGNSGLGAIANTGILTVTNSTFAGNSGGYGGAIFHGGGTLTVTDSTFSDNSGSTGGAIRNLGDTLTVINSTFSNNSASSAGGAIANQATLVVINSTFSSNSGPTDSGGAIDNEAGCGDAGNAPCSATLRNTMVANSTQGRNCSGTITDGGHNLDDGTSCGFSAANGSLSNTDPKLDPAGLENNGGPTQTVALCTAVGVPAGCTAVSPAIDAGDQAVCGSSGEQP